MEGYEVITSDDARLGHVVGLDGGILIVEHGWLRKRRLPVPESFAHADEGERVVRLSVSKQLVQDAPEIDDRQVDQQAVARYYGLAGGFEAPETEGAGELLPDDPGLSAEQEGLRAGVEPQSAERARVREGDAPLDKPPARRPFR